MSWKSGFGEVFKFGCKWSTTIDPRRLKFFISIPPKIRTPLNNFSQHIVKSANPLAMHICDTHIFMKSQ